MQTDFINLIPTGKKNAISCRELSKLSGINARVLKAQISKCRRKGAIICSSLDEQNGGYFQAASTEELIEYVRIESARIKTAQAALQPAIDEVVRRTGV